MSQVYLTANKILLKQFFNFIFQLENLKYQVVWAEYKDYNMQIICQ